MDSWYLQSKKIIRVFITAYFIPLQFLCYEKESLNQVKSSVVASVGRLHYIARSIPKVRFFASFVTALCWTI